MSYHRNQILQAIASLEKVGASIFFSRSLSHAHSFVPLLEKPSSSPSCIPVCFLSSRPPNSALIAPFRLLSCASTLAPRSWAGGWPQFPRGFLPRPRLGESADSKTLSRGAEGRAWLGAAGREMRGGAAGAEREGHGGGAAGAGGMRVPILGARKTPCGRRGRRRRWRTSKRQTVLGCSLCPGRLRPVHTHSKHNNLDFTKPLGKIKYELQV